MTVYSKQSYEDQDDRRILKAAWKQQYIMFPGPEEECDATFCSLKVPMDYKDKDSKTNMVKVKKYDTETLAEFLRWRLVWSEKIKNHGYSENYGMVMNLAQAMLAGCSLEAFFNERRAQETKTKYARQRSKQSTLHNIFMILQCLNWQSALFTSKVDG
jgi:hypothetical protein